MQLARQAWIKPRATTVCSQKATQPRPSLDSGGFGIACADPIKDYIDQADKLEQYARKSMDIPGLDFCWRCPSTASLTHNCACNCANASQIATIAKTTERERGFHVFPALLHWPPHLCLQLATFNVY